MTPHFSDKELACRCCGLQGMDPQFMSKLESVRLAYGKPMIVSSAYRCDDHNKSIGGSYRHPMGEAIDIRVYGPDALRLVKIALLFGYTGIGVKQHGPHERRFIHIDTLGDGHGGTAFWGYP